MVVSASLPSEKPTTGSETFARSLRLRRACPTQAQPEAPSILSGRPPAGSGAALRMRSLTYRRRAQRIHTRGGVGEATVLSRAFSWRLRLGISLVSLLFSISSAESRPRISERSFRESNSQKLGPQ